MVVKNTVSNSDAASKCQEEGANLASIGDANENDLLKELWVILLLFLRHCNDGNIINKYNC